MAIYAAGFVLGLFLAFNFNEALMLGLILSGVCFPLMLLNLYLYGISDAVEDTRDNLHDIKELLQNAAVERKKEVTEAGTAND